MARLKEDDIILCKVQKIEGTTVFLEVPESSIRGTMALSEVAAGRIRNLRQYVSPNRLIVCKVLRMGPDHIELSLRRVTSKERDGALDTYKKEKAFRNVLKFVGEDPEKIIGKIKENGSLGEFFLEIESPTQLESLMDKEKAKKVFEAFSEKEEKDRSVGRKFILRSEGENGVGDIKEILDFDNVEIHYLGSSRFSIEAKGKDFKEANIKMQNVFDEMEKRAKKKKALLEIGKEK
jgi:translation initiation factor 2 alpha subunit (eIF-2alpha)